MTREFELKPISPDAVPAALERADRYRLLNEPMQAESICLDVLEVEPQNRDALKMLLLALADQFEKSLQPAFRRARELLARFPDEYGRIYYEGLIYERRGKAQLSQGSPGSGYVVYDCLRRAMDSYERAAELREPGNEESILRWNTCARIIMRFPNVRPEPEQQFQPMLE